MFGRSSRIADCRSPSARVVPQLGLALVFAVALTMEARGQQAPSTSSGSYNFFEDWKIDRRTNKPNNGLNGQPNNGGAQPQPTANSAPKMPPMPPTSQIAGVLAVTADELAQRGEDRAAVMVYEKGKRIDPRASDFARRLAPLYDKIGDPARATAAYQESLAQSPKDADLWVEAGQFHLRGSHLLEAENCLRQALALAPSHSKAWMSMGQLLATSGRNSEAYDAFARVVGPVAAHAQMGTILAQQEHEAEARAAFERALASSPNYEPAQAALKALSGTGGPSQAPQTAATEAKKTTDEKPSPPAPPWAKSVEPAGYLGPPGTIR